MQKRKSAISFKNLILSLLLIASILPFSNFAISGAHLRSCHHETGHEHEIDFATKKSLIQLEQICQHENHLHREHISFNAQPCSCSCAPQPDHQHRADCTACQKTKIRRNQAEPTPAQQKSAQKKFIHHQKISQSRNFSAELPTALSFISTICLII